MTCNDAVRIILAADETKIDQALALILNQPTCLARFDQLARAILSPLELEISCAEARTQFVAYHEQQTNGGEPAPALLEIAAHLQRCPYCLFEYRSLTQLLARYDQDPIMAVEPTPNFDLTFLPAAPAQPFWQWRDEVRSFAETIAIAVTQTAALFQPLTTASVAVQVSAAQLRTGDPPAQYATLILPASDAPLRFQLETTLADPGHALLALRIFAVAAETPISDARVTLRTESGQLLMGARTAADGRVVFQSLATGNYRLQLRYQGETWEVPISIMPLS